MCSSSPDPISVATSSPSVVSAMALIDRPDSSTRFGCWNPSAAAAASIAQTRPGTVVREDVPAGERRLGLAAVHRAAGDGAAQVVAVLRDRQRRVRDLAGRLTGRVAMRALHQVPAEVESADPGRRPVDLLPRSLADVADPQVAGGSVEPDPPRVAQAGVPDLGHRACRVHERVVGRDRVAHARRGTRSRRRCAGSWRAGCRGAAPSRAGRRRRRRRRSRCTGSHRGRMPGLRRCGSRRRSSIRSSTCSLSRCARSAASRSIRNDETTCRPSRSV